MTTWCFEAALVLAGEFVDTSAADQIKIGSIIPCVNLFQGSQVGSSTVQNHEAFTYFSHLTRLTIRENLQDLANLSPSSMKAPGAPTGYRPSPHVPWWKRTLPTSWSSLPSRKMVDIVSENDVDGKLLAGAVEFLQEVLAVGKRRKPWRRDVKVRDV